MAEYCKQCFDELFPPGTPNTLTIAKNSTIPCEGCGETIVDSKGRCTGACGKDKHSSNFMSYIFETRPPGLTFADIGNKSIRGRFFKLCVDIIQFFPRIMFVFGLLYMFGTAICLRILEINKKPEELEKAAELSSSKASNIYENALRFWYKVEMRLENFLFG